MLHDSNVLPPDTISRYLKGNITRKGCKSVTLSLIGMSQNPDLEKRRQYYRELWKRLPLTFVFTMLKKHIKRTERIPFLHILGCYATLPETVSR